jgi:hypothetical protein
METRGVRRAVGLAAIVALSGVFLMSSFALMGWVPKGGAQLRPFNGLQANATWTGVTQPAGPGISGTVSFSGTGVGGVAPYTCKWDWGDSHTSLLCGASHGWNNGTYLVTLTVTDHSGAKASAAFHIYSYVNGGGGGAHFRGGLSGGIIIGWHWLGPCGPAWVWCTPTPCNCFNTQSYSTAWNGVSPVSFTTSWGDGTYGNTWNPSHSYAGSGSYNVGSSVTDANHNTAQHTFGGVSVPL